MLYIIFNIVVLLICVLISGCFSCAETSLFSLSKSKIKLLSDKGGKKEKLLEQHLNNPQNLLITILIGNMFANIFAASLSERVVTNIFPDFGLGISIIVMTFIIILFSEITPKVIGVHNSQKISLFAIKYIDIFYKFVSPLRKILFKLSDYFVSMISNLLGKDQYGKVSYDEIKTIVTESHKEGILLEHEKEMIEGTIKLKHITVKDIMTPRTEMISFDLNETPEKIYKAVRKGKFSRIPVYESNIDNIIGILYIKDYLLIKGHEQNIKNILKKPYFVPGSQIVSDLFSQMRKTSVHMAIVVDEYGGIDGVITMEDILEEVFGDIIDKKDALLSLKKISPELMKISGKLTIDDFNEIFSTNIKDGTNITIAGHILSLLGYIPQKGEVIKEDGIEYTISLSKKNRIEEILVNSNPINNKRKPDPL